MFKVAATVLAIGFSVIGYATLGMPAQSTPAATPPLVIPPAASALQNPVKPSDENIAKAKKIYKLDCAMCHGDNGDGKGELAVSANFVIKDYRDPASLKSRTDGDIFYMIRNGYGTMPAEDQRAKDADVWALVNYLRSFSGK